MTKELLDSFDKNKTKCCACKKYDYKENTHSLRSVSARSILGITTIKKLAPNIDNDNNKYEICILCLDKLGYC